MTIKRKGVNLFICGLILAIFSWFFWLNNVNAVYRISLKDWYDRYYFYPSKHKELFWFFDKYYWNWEEIILTEWEIKNFLEYDSLEKKTLKWVNKAYLKKFITEEIVPQINQEWTWATLSLADWISHWWMKKASISNQIFINKKLDVDLTISLIQKAIKENIDEVELPIIETEPKIEIAKELREKWINWIYSISKSDFSDSSINRIKNVKNGLKQYDWIIIKPWDEFSFNQNLWSVDARNGFVKEYVIKSNSITKEYWWWICQVSTTLYRTLMNWGFEIWKRRNHSFAVNHYEPQGSDATIYLWWQDLTFKNTTTWNLVIHNATKGEFAYFVILWNKEVKPEIKLFWPYISNYINQPADIYQNSTTLKPWQKRLLVWWQRWFTSTWFRVVNWETEMIQSKYNAIPNTWKIGWAIAKKD